MPIYRIAEVAVLLAIVLALGAGMIWLVKRLRDVEANDRPDSSGMLTNFRELHSRGGLSDEEYRTIKTKLADQLQADMGVEGAELLGGGERAEQSSSAADDAGQGAL